MENERKRSPAAFLAMATVVAAVLYVASFGPACWITSRLQRGNQYLPVVYRPIVALMPFSDAAPLIFPGVRGGRVYSYPEGAICSYARFGAAPGWMWRYSAEFARSRTPGVAFDRESDWLWEWCPSAE